MHFPAGFDMDGKSPDRDREYSEQETARRADAALRVALSTPHKPHKPLGKRQIKRSRSKAKPSR
jgi:hypothetical protein